MAGAVPGSCTTILIDLLFTNLGRGPIYVCSINSYKIVNWKKGGNGLFNCLSIEKGHDNG